MSRIVWAFGWAGVLAWSLFAFLAYGLVDLLGGFMARHADLWSSNPETVETIWRVLNGIHSLSTTLVLIVWGLVSLALLSVPWLVTRALKSGVQPAAGFRAGPQAFRAAWRFGMAPPRPGRARPPAEDGVIDLEPDQYSVRPVGSGVAPRIAPDRRDTRR